MFELCASIANTAQQKLEVETLNKIIACKQAEIIQKGKNNEILKKNNQALVKSTEEVEQHKMMEQQKGNINKKTWELEFEINGLKPKNQCFMKPSTLAEMFTKSESRRKEEVKEFTKEIGQLRSILTDQNQKLDSLKEFNKVLKATDTFEPERNVKVGKHSFGTGANEIYCKMNNRIENEKKYAVVIENFGLAVDFFEKRALRNKDAMKKHLKYSEKFKDELQEAKNKIEKLDSENWRLRRQVRSLKADLENHSSYHTYYNKKIENLKSDFEDEWAKIRESRKQRTD